jgi:hypothetical protein
MQQTELWLEKGRLFLCRWRDRLNAPPLAVQPSVWYSGLGIEPTEFSEQLVRLQTSLNHANGDVLLNDFSKDDLSKRDRTAPVAR